MERGIECTYPVKVTNLNNWVKTKLTLTLAKLEPFLWKSADILRGSIDSSKKTKLSLFYYIS